MAPVAVGDIIRVTAKMFLDGSNDIVNVFHFKVNINTSADDDAFMTEVASAMDTLYTLVNARVTTRITYSSVQGFNVTQTELLPDKPWPILTAGLDTDDMIPEMNAACCFHRTITPKVRASKFLAGAGETSNAGGALETTYKSLIQAFADSLLATLVTANVTLQYGAFNVVLSLFRPVVTALVPDRFRTQKRRRIGVGS